MQWAVAVGRVKEEIYNGKQGVVSSEEKAMFRVVESLKK